MKIAIVGMGVAGSYLSSRLSEKHQVTGFDMLSKDKFDAVCGWGTTKEGLSKFASNCGLNFDDYIVFTGKNMQIKVKDEMINMELRGMCCFDKIRFINDMADGININYGKFISRNNFKENFDLIIDSTGISRVLLPRIKNDLIVPCLQYKVKYKVPPFNDFYIKPFPGISGYFWYFPLGDGYFHVGAGDYYKHHIEELSSFLKRYPGEIIKKNGRPIRITPPSLCEPFYEGNIVGVGESIGTVYPILGEGIIPSLQCAELLVENINDLPKYREEVLQKFNIYTSVFNVVKSKINHNFNLALQIPSLWSTYHYMKKREDRFGMHIQLIKMLKIILGS